MKDKRNNVILEEKKYGIPAQSNEMGNVIQKKKKRDGQKIWAMIPTNL